MLFITKKGVLMACCSICERSTKAWKCAGCGIRFCENCAPKFSYTWGRECPKCSKLSDHWLESYEDDEDDI